MNQIRNEKDDKTHQQCKIIKSTKEEWHRDKEEIAKLRELLKRKQNTVLIKSEKEKDWLDKKTMHESDCQEIRIKD